jgi:hypothetical protein
MDQSNTFADGVNYGQVTIEADSTAGTVKFTVDVFDVQPLYGELDNFGIDKFGFNYTNVTSTFGIDDPTGWTDDTDKSMDGFGKFMVLITGPGSRQTQLVFTLTGLTESEAVASNFAVLSTGNAGEGNVFFAAHVGGFDTSGGIGSHYIGGSSVVPAPEAMILGMVGLGLVGKAKRRFA